MLKQLNGGRTLCYLSSFHSLSSLLVQIHALQLLQFLMSMQMMPSSDSWEAEFCNLAFAVNRIQLRREVSYKGRCWVLLSLVRYSVSSITYNIWSIVERGAVSQYIGFSGQKSKPKPESIISSFKLEFQFHQLNYLSF